MSASRERIARRLGERRGAAGSPELAGEEIGDERLGRGIRRVVDHQPMRSEQRFEPPGEGVGHADLRPVRGTKRGHEPLGELGLAERAGEFVEAVLDAAVQLECSDRPLAGALGLWQRDRVRLEAGVEHRTARHLFPVVILGIHPEHWNHIRLLLPCGVTGQLDCRDGLEQREERAAERPGLLTGEDGDRPVVGELAGGLARGRWGAPSFLLGCKKSRDLRTRSSHPARARDRLGPGLSRRRVAGIERRDLGEVEGVVSGERPDPAKTAHVDRGAGRAVGERRFRCHRLVLSQSPANHVKTTTGGFDAFREAEGSACGKTVLNFVVFHVLTVASILPALRARWRGAP